MRYAVAAAIIGAISLAAIGAGTMPGSKPADVMPQFKIENYSFEWSVVKTGDVALTIEKTQDTTVVRLRSDMNMVTMKPAEAEAVAMALAKTDTYYQSMKGGNDKRETLNAGEWTVTFSNDAKYGFSIYISDGSTFPSRISINRSDAVALSGHMAKARAMVSFVDARIRP